jgi:glycine/D-amino acid oxidase-like deaminating enzyme
MSSGNSNIRTTQKGACLAGSEKIAAAGIAYARFGGDEVMRRFPQFRLDQEVDALWQADTGSADAAKGNAAHIGMARYYGATILESTGVESIRPFEGGVDVTTQSGRFTCRSIAKLLSATAPGMPASLRACRVKF